MRKFHLLEKICTALLLTLIGAVSSYGQLAAGFSANRTVGCAPLVVQFRDESVGNPTNWRWELGNGTLSYLQNPASTYFNPGTYTIKLVVSNGNQTDSVIKTQYLTVFASPTVNFAASDTSGCFPLRVQFTDLSSSGDGTITSWLWDFGDGDTSALQNPQHTYTDGGNYNVSLQVRNNRGCIQSITRLNYIKLNNGVKAGFTVGSSANCRPPTNISFTNTSTGTGALSYQWIFGDGGTSSQQNPTHTYNNAGIYTVRLIVRNNTGCVDSMVLANAISIGTVDAAFTSPSIVCAGKPVSFLNNSTPAPTGAYWDFGDASSSMEINPSKAFALPGIYTVKLVSIFGACRDSVTRPIQVLAKPVSNFNAANTNACKPPLNVSYSQLASGAVSYKWFFGDGDSSVLADPSHVYNTYGVFDVMLVTTNAAGCTDTVRKNGFINIQRPDVSILQVPQEGCIPYYYRPAISVNSPDSIINYKWDFGDGNTSTQAQPENIYTTAGSFTVKLIYTTSGGCTDSVIATNAVIVGEKPIVSFTATPRFACAFQPISFKDLSTGPVGSRWFWTFGDGGTSTEKDPIHIYQDTGWFAVSLVVWNNGCKDSLRIPNFINIKPPVARFVDSAGCGDKFTRWFIDRSLGANSWFWNFGDGSTSSDQNPVHTFAASGSYIVTLTVKNDTCEHTSTRQVVIIAERASFSASDSIVCKGTVVNFNAQNILATNIRDYQWDFGDGSFGNNANAGHIYTRTGVYTVRLIITDINGCRDTLIKPQYITVNGPTADFITQSPAVCNLSTVEFLDSSYWDGTHPIKQWIWNYGDGITDTLTAPPFRHTYLTPGIFNVSLTVMDSIGCRDRQQRTSYLTISKPSPAFSSPDTVSCTNKVIRFLNQTTGNGPMTYHWSFGNATISTAAQPTSSYSAEGEYNVHLLVTDRFGCKDSITKNNYIKIRDPEAVFTVSDSVATCPPLIVTFNNQSRNYASYEWDFGDGTRSMAANPIHFYTYPGVYRAKLTITSIGGCIDSLIKIITVRGPQGTFRYDNLGGCEPTTVGFTGMTKDLVSFIWDFNDGTVMETGDSIVSHTYTRRGIYLPKMILKDPQGCQVSIPGKDTIRIYGVDAKPGLSQQLFCDSGMVHFRDSSVSNDLITAHRWDLGDGNLSNQQHPSHFYRRPGSYPIQLIVTTQSGCRDTAHLLLPIKIVESPIVGIQADTGACVPAIANFSGRVIRNDNEALQWQWSFGNGNSSNLQNPTPVTYGVANSYAIRLIGTNSSGCADTVYHNYTAFPLPLTDAGADRVICRNTVTDLVGTGAIQYSWSPSTGLSCTDCPAPKASPLEQTTYHLMGKNIYGCFASDSVLIRVQQPFNMEVGRGDTICVGESYQLFASGADQYLWTPATGLDNSRTDKPKAQPGNSVVYRVVGSDNYGCFTDTGSVAVVVYPYPKVNAGADKTISVGNSVPLAATISGDVTGINWIPATGLSCNNCANPVATPRQTTTYNVEVVNQGGCKTKDEITVFVFCDNSNLFVPNTFSPNADGNNDVFYPRGKGLFTIKILRVFNRWGEVVFERTNFEANDATKGWDGMHKGRAASQDVYVYTIEVICENNTVLTYSGNVALIR